MIWQAWALLVLIGTLWSYVAFVTKTAAVWSGLATFGFFAVSAIGALNLQTQYASETEIAVAVLCAVYAFAGLIVAVAAFTGQYGDSDEDQSPGGGEVRKLIGGDPR